MRNKINLACGDNYIVSNEWLNVDFESNSKSVKKINLLKKLPFPDNSFEIIYSSHFIEHIDYNQVDSFLSECSRILKPGGSIRIVTPDFEKLCKFYLNYLEKKEFEKKEFLMFQILDQLVRKKGGGGLRSKINNYKSNKEMLKFINYWNGEDIKALSKKKFAEKVYKKFFNLYIKLILIFLPKSFKMSNMSLTDIGEKHQWLWDFDSLSKKIANANLYEIKKKTFNETDINNLELKDLDYINEDTPRKGHNSMYIEAKKN